MGWEAMPSISHSSGCRLVEFDAEVHLPSLQVPCQLVVLSADVEAMSECHKLPC
jgi:hypothetical protein